MSDKINPPATTSLPRIGDLIEGATGIKYDTYAQTQKKLGLEAAMAAIVEHSGHRDAKGGELKDTVYALLKSQADRRMSAVEKDAERVIGGEQIQGLKSTYLMVQITKPDAPEISGDDRAKLAKAAVAVKDPGWLVAEGASNITNFARDMLSSANGAKLNDEQKTAMRSAVVAARQATDAMVNGKPLAKSEMESVMQRLDKGMDAAVQAGGATLANDTDFQKNYTQYRKGIREGISSGMGAIAQAQAIEAMKGSQLAHMPDNEYKAPPPPAQSADKGKG